MRINYNLKNSVFIFFIGTSVLKVQYLAKILITHVYDRLIYVVDFGKELRAECSTEFKPPPDLRILIDLL